MQNNGYMTYGGLCREGGRVLQNAGIEDAEYDSLALLEYVSGIDRTWYLLNRGNIVDEDTVSRYTEAVKKRAEHMPLQYITGEAWFYGRCFTVNTNVLIPRQDTETLVEEALRHVSAGASVLDMCTGSGCILISIALNVKLGRGIGIDISGEAVKLAGVNKKRLGAENIEFYQGNLFESLNSEDTFDVIISNPPYIRTRDIEGLPEEIKLHEPAAALDGSEDGLYFYRKITEASSRFINQSGWLIYEIGSGQAADVSGIMSGYGYKDISVIKDLAGLDRVVAGHR